MDWSGHFKLQLNWEKLADIFLTCWVSLEFRVAFWNILDHKFDQTPGHDADPISGGELRFHNKHDNPASYGSFNLPCALHRKYCCSWMFLIVIRCQPLSLRQSSPSLPLTSHLYLGEWNFSLTKCKRNFCVKISAGIWLCGFNARDCFSQKSGIQD